MFEFFSAVIVANPGVRDHTLSKEIEVKHLSSFPAIMFNIIKQVKLRPKSHVMQDSYLKPKLHIMSQFLEYNENKTYTSKASFRGIYGFCKVRYHYH